MHIRSCLLLYSSLAFAFAPALSQAQNQPAVNHRVNLAASASVQVAQDLLTLSLSVVREGNDAHLLQTQINAALETAMQLARRESKPGLMEVRSGPFNLSPRYGRDGKLSGWQGSAGLILEGRDFARITETAGKLQTMTVASINFGLTPEQFQAAQTKAQTQAIAKFRNNATDIAKGFGFSDYTLGEVNIGAETPAPMVRQRMLASASMAGDAPIAAEGGTSQVTVTVSGSVQLK
ncbi:MAG: SIMPL domain-containing protein [Rhodoferax sp.]|nr:SIMPL domain-containing protein [Rhodoferax sp.]